MWIILAILSALCLGFYDICKKQSLNANSVIGVLSISVFISSVVLFPQWFLSRIMPETMAGSLFFVPSVDLRTHFFIVLKAGIVLSSWLCAYKALKHLPISLVAPMQATRPVWTLLGALLIFHEVLNKWQWAGIICALGSVIIYSLVESRKEKAEVSAHRTYLVFLIFGILLGSASGLYDKYLMRQFDHNAVQVYYTWYQAVMMLFLSCFCRFNNSQRQRNQSIFRWKWTIIGVSIFLVLSDFFYLLALSDSSSLIAVVSTTRRVGTVIPFLFGILVLHEPHPHRKVQCLAGILLGLVFLLIGTI